MRYVLSLLNTDSSLDLIPHSSDIQIMFNFIQSGGITGLKFKEVSKITLLHINKRSIMIDVVESSKHWHAHVGFLLKNDYGMSIFCITNGTSGEDIMFQWH